MADHSEGYQSLSSISREQRQRSSMAGMGVQRRDPSGSGSGAPGSETRVPPLRKMVRMASDLFTPSNRPALATRISSRNDIPKQQQQVQHFDYGTLNKTSPLRARDNSAIADEDEATTVAGDDDDDDDEYHEDQWGNWRLIMLTIGLAGAQLAWTIELGYGTPYLLSLGLSKELTSLVWLAGPISGFVVQPIIGALSDNSSSRYRRRRWVVYTTTLITLSALMLAFASEMATGLVDLFNRGQGDWDPKRNADIRLTAIGIAVLAFYILDFSLNGAQAALRALVLDLVPSDQQTMANAYLARMANIGNIVGYGFGFINLTSSVLLRWIGGGQFRKLCILSVTVLDICVIITCVMNPEERLPKIKRDKSIKKVFSNILAAARDLPVPIRRVCYVQLCGFSGLFSTMFYSTTWVGARYKLQFPEHPPSDDTATRAGSLALLFQSIVAVVTSLLLPIVQSIGSSDYILSRPPTRGWNAIRYALSLWTPRNLWTFSYVWFVLVIGSTFFVSTHEQAIVTIAALGISITIIGWIPFAILMEFIREMEAGAELNGDVVISAAEVAESMIDGVEGRGGAESYLSVPGGKPRSRRQSKASSMRSRRSSVKSNRSGRQRVAKAVGECRPLLEGDEEDQVPQKTEGGTILGIHNLAIVSPQFLTAIAASIIFKISELTEDSPYRRRHGIESGADVVWVLRYGGFVTIFAAIVSRWVPAAPSETIYVNELRAACEPEDED